MPQQWRSGSVLVLAAVAAAGCASRPAVSESTYADTGYAAYPEGGAPYAAYPAVEPAAGPVAAAPAAVAAPQMAPAATAYPALVDPVMVQRTAAMQAEIAKQDERLQRIERAMLRLDRRMQLVERNELGRMNGAALENTEGNNQVSSADDVPSFQPVPSFSRAGYADGFQPVSTPITSALQGAPVAGAPRPETAGQAGGRVVTSNQLADSRLPSLADPAAAAPRLPGGEDRLAIWTVNYDADKIWPDRTQLSASRDVVSLLREGAKVTVFARGPQPNSREFRERVKALSRYLAKVTSLDSVPIAALAAPHLSGDTIEIFAAP